MISYGRETKLGPAQVIERAVRFFGPGGVGLEVKDRGEGCALFEGGGGFVSVSCCEAENRTQVSLESREWDSQAGRFIASL